MLAAAAFPVGAAVLLELAPVAEPPPAALVLVAPTVVIKVTFEDGVTAGVAIVEADVVELEPRHLVQTVLVSMAVLMLVLFTDAEVTDAEAEVLVTLALAEAVPDADPEEEEDPPVMWNGKEYWKIEVSESSAILNP